MARKFRRNASAAYRHTMTALQRAALKKAQLISAQKRKQRATVGINDLVKITGRVSGKGSIGRVVGSAPSGKFFQVKIGKSTHSYHESDFNIRKKYR